ncbi:MAG: DNA alkylation repair protein, partial [Rhodobacteraceae bacterium]|nr:DNA alkylation repair protein [Paracoccaceae bacterium]
MRSPQDTTTGPQAVSGFRTALLAALRERSDPVRAEQQRRYMKSDIPFFGVAVPEVRRITRATSRTYRFASADAWQAAILS